MRKRGGVGKRAGCNEVFVKACENAVVRVIDINSTDIVRDGFVAADIKHKVNGASDMTMLQKGWHGSIVNTCVVECEFGLS